MTSMASILCLGLTFEVFSMDSLHIDFHSLWCIFVILPSQHSVTGWHFKYGFISYFFWLFQIVRMTRIPWWIVSEDEAALDFDPVDENHLGLTSFHINLQQEVNGCIYLASAFCESDGRSPCRAWWELFCCSIACRSGSSPSIKISWKSFRSRLIDEANEYYSQPFLFILFQPSPLIMKEQIHVRLLQGQRAPKERMLRFNAYCRDLSFFIPHLNLVLFHE